MKPKYGYRYDIRNYNYCQKCMTHFEIKAKNPLDLMEQLSRVMTEKEMSSITNIKRLKKVRIN